jgi:hypothetical protein
MRMHPEAGKGIFWGAAFSLEFLQEMNVLPEPAACLYLLNH